MPVVDNDDAFDVALNIEDQTIDKLGINEQNVAVFKQGIEILLEQFFSFLRAWYIEPSRYNWINVSFASCLSL